MSEAIAAPATDYSKLVVVLLVLMSANLLIGLERINAEAWVSATTWTVAAYLLGQVGTVVATGWSVQATAKAMATMKAGT